jgi:hypothetical protein
MKCSIIKKRDGQLWMLHSDGFDTIEEARVKLANIANDLDEGEWWSYSNDKLVYDVYTYKIVKTSSITKDAILKSIVILN